jgi:hypothetical protein
VPPEPEPEPVPPEPEPIIVSDGAITNLFTKSPHSSSLILSWSAPELQGEKPQAYDLRYSEHRIREWMWDKDYVIAVSGLSVPKSTGASEEFVVSGLSPDTSYYFSIRAIYSNGVVSELSNIAIGSTLPVYSGRDIYVDVNAPAGGNGTIDEPFNSVRDGCRESTSGDVVRILEGIYYQDSCSVRSNTSIVSESGPLKAVIDGEGVIQHLVAIWGDDNVVIDGLELRNTGGGSDGNDIIWIDGAGSSNQSYNIKLRNLYVHNAGSVGDCIKVTNYVDGFLLENSRLHSAWGPSSGEVEELLDMKLTANATIRYNWFHHIEGRREGAMAYSKTDSSNIIFENNIFGPQSTLASDSAVGGGWSSSSVNFNTDGLVIRNNLFFHTYYSAVGAYGAKDEFIYNNVFYNSGRGDGGILRIQEGGSQDDTENLYFVNNIIIDDDGLMPDAIVRKQQISDVTNFQHHHNIYWNASSAIPTTGYINPVYEEGFIEADPDFNPSIQLPDTFNYDELIDMFMPQSLSSVAIDSGFDATSVPAMLPAQDILGTDRLLGSGYDRGIFEMAP